MAVLLCHLLDSLESMETRKPPLVLRKRLTISIENRYGVSYKLLLLLLPLLLLLTMERGSWFFYAVKVRNSRSLVIIVTTGFFSFFITVTFSELNSYLRPRVGRFFLHAMVYCNIGSRVRRFSLHPRYFFVLVIERNLLLA